MPSVVVASSPPKAQVQQILDTLAGQAEVVFLAEVEERARAEALRGATAVIAFNPAKELRNEEWPLLVHAKLVQFTTAGVDFIPFERFPEGIQAAANRGGYAEPMAEHALAMALAAAKRLLPEHHELQAGRFNQFVPNRTLLGATCGIVGFGGIGIAVARLFRRLDMRIVAMNRRGQSDEPVDFLGGPKALEQVLREADVLVLATPLTVHTVGMLGARELGWMRPDAILINLARGEIINEDALFAHLQANPGFQACLDAWWIEPVRHGRFTMGHPFLDLPNVMGSPHNSASVPDGRQMAMGRVLENVQRVLRGEPPHHLLGPDDRPPE